MVVETADNRDHMVKIEQPTPLTCNITDEDAQSNFRELVDRAVNW